MLPLFDSFTNILEWENPPGATVTWTVTRLKESTPAREWRTKPWMTVGVPREPKYWVNPYSNFLRCRRALLLRRLNSFGNFPCPLGRACGRGSIQSVLRVTSNEQTGTRTFPIWPWEPFPAVAAAPTESLSVASARVEQLEGDLISSCTQSDRDSVRYYRSTVTVCQW